MRFIAKRCKTIITTLKARTVAVGGILFSVNGCCYLLMGCGCTNQTGQANRNSMKAKSRLSCAVFYNGTNISVSSLLLEPLYMVSNRQTKEACGAAMPGKRTNPSISGFCQIWILAVWRMLSAFPLASIKTHLHDLWVIRFKE